MLDFRGMRSTYSMLSLSGPLWSGEVASDRVTSMVQIELFDNYIVFLNWIELSEIGFAFIINCVLPKILYVC